MFRTLGVAVALLATTAARAQTQIDAFTDATEDRVNIALTDRSGQTARCTLPYAGGCHLSFSPGDLELHIKTDGHVLDKLLHPSGDHLGLRVTYHSAGMAITGLSLLAGGLAFGVLSAVEVAQPGASESTASTVGIVTVLAGLLITGALLTGIGFNRYGFTADLTPLPEVPFSARPQAPPTEAIPLPPETLPPPPVVVPPPAPSAPWQDSRSDT